MDCSRKCVMLAWYCSQLIISGLARRMCPMSKRNGKQAQLDATGNYRKLSIRRTTMTPKVETNTYRTTARVVGLIYLAGFVVGIVGQVMSQSILGAPNRLSAISVNSMPVAI